MKECENSGTHEQRKSLIKERASHKTTHLSRFMFKWKAEVQNLWLSLIFVYLELSLQWTKFTSGPNLWHETCAESPLLFILGYNTRLTETLPCLHLNNFGIFKIWLQDYVYVIIIIKLMQNSFMFTSSWLASVPRILGVVFTFSKFLAYFDTLEWLLILLRCLRVGVQVVWRLLLTL